MTSVYGCYHSYVLCGLYSPYSLLPLRYSVLPPVYPSSLRSLAFFKWDDSVDGVEPPPALNLHLVLSVSFLQRSCVSYKFSVVGRRLFRPVRVLATC